MRHTCLLVAIVALGLASCGGDTREDARELVERYNQVVGDAYRRCDIKLIDSVVGPDTTAGKRLTGLIGVRLDMGVALDAEMTSLDITSVQETEDALEIRTRERWRYRDLEIGTGKQVGEASVDSYEMVYELAQWDGQWLVAETRFAAPPEIGRKTTPWSADAKVLHQPLAPLAQEEENP